MKSPAKPKCLIQKYQKVARLPGFRSGHVPASIIRQRFTEDIKSDVVEALVPRYFRQEAEKQGLIPVSQPRVTDLHIHDGEPLRFKASFEIMPEIKVEGYKELARRQARDRQSPTKKSKEAVNDVARAARDLHRDRRPRRWPTATSRRSRWTASRRRTSEGTARAHGRSAGRDRRQEHDARIHREPARRQRRRRARRSK